MSCPVREDKNTPPLHYKQHEHFALSIDKGTFDSMETLSRTPAFTAKPPHVARSVRWQSCHVSPIRLSALCLYLLQAKSYNPQNRESYVKQMYSWYMATLTWFPTHLCCRCSDKANYWQCWEAIGKLLECQCQSNFFFII